MADNSFLGKGVAFDFNVDESGKIKLISSQELIKESIFIILSTKIGERVMNYNFGCKIHDLMFELNTIYTRNEASRYVREALERWEKRIIIKNIEVETGRKNELLIDIEYYIRDSNVIDNFVYPFYLFE